MKRLGLVMLVVVSACGDDRLRGVQRDDAGALQCGPGTVYQPATDQCVAELICGAGTVRQGNSCVAVAVDAGRDAGTDGGADAGLDAGMDAGMEPDAGPTGCGTAPNALFFEGSGYVFTGTQLVTAGAFTASGDRAHALIHVDPTASSQGLWWDATFASPVGTELQVQRYPMATRYPFQAPTAAGLSVTGDGRGCNQSSGNFEVLAVERDDAGTLTFFEATFEQLCENQPTNVLRGCVRFTR